MHADRIKVICEYSRLLAAGDWERYTAPIIGKSMEEPALYVL
jgi:hypothetical protein